MNSPDGFDSLNRHERLLLMRFVCSFAWADFEIRDEERRWISALIGRLDLDDDERQQVASWLESPPAEESIDPSLVPAEHRLLFLTAIQSLIETDGEVSEEEAESFQVLEQLVG